MKYFTLFSLKLSLPSSCEIVSILNNRRSFDNLFILRKINHSQPKMQELSGTSITINTQTATTRLSDLNKTLTSRATSTSSNVIPKCLQCCFGETPPLNGKTISANLSLRESYSHDECVVIFQSPSRKEVKEREKNEESKEERGEVRGRRENLVGCLTQSINKNI